jgi:lysyl-tRNA synthetase class 1
VAAPQGSTAPSYARHFAGLFLATFAGLGIHPETYWMSEVYATGAVDPYLRLALDRAARVREIYRRVANVQHPPSWHPVSVICEACGKVGTTIVTDWDGRRVFYECRPDLVGWARGCGHSGWVEPFGGRAKLPWNLEWAAQWSIFGVTIEPNGKDLATAGGSRDRSDAIAREIFEREPPLNLPYEFVNVGGRKMSTSKGQGAAAHTMAEVLPPELLRFLFLRYRPTHAIDFDPSGETIPRLFDEFDRVAAATAGRPVKGELPPDLPVEAAMAVVMRLRLSHQPASALPSLGLGRWDRGVGRHLAAATAGRPVKGELPPDHGRIFALSLLDPEADAALEASRFRPNFAQVAMLAQIPGVDLDARVEAEKGAPLDLAEQVILADRARSARAWLEAYAPDRARVAVRDQFPDEARHGLAEEQRAYLGAMALAAEVSRPGSGEAWQDLIFRVAEEAALPAGRAFAAIYLAFLGRTSGPRAGWLLAALEREFTIERLRVAAGWSPEPEGEGSAGPAGEGTA